MSTEPIVANAPDDVYIPEELDLTEENKALDKIKDKVSEMEELIGDMKTFGVNRDIAEAVENVVPGTITPRLAMESYTKLRSPTNLKLTMKMSEGVQTGLRLAALGVIAVMVAKIFSWVYEAFTGNGDACEGADKSFRHAAETQKVIDKNTSEMLRIFDKNEAMFIKAVDDEAERQGLGIKITTISQARDGMKKIAEHIQNVKLEHCKGAFLDGLIKKHSEHAEIIKGLVEKLPAYARETARRNEAFLNTLTHGTAVNIEHDSAKGYYPNMNASQSKHESQKVHDLYRTLLLSNNGDMPKMEAIGRVDFCLMEMAKIDSARMGLNGLEESIQRTTEKAQEKLKNLDNKSEEYENIELVLATYKDAWMVIRNLFVTIRGIETKSKQIVNNYTAAVTATMQAYVKVSKRVGKVADSSDSNTLDRIVEEMDKKLKEGEKT